VQVYLDTCCLNHPFDEQNDERAILETEAILGIILSPIAISGEYVRLPFGKTDSRVTLSGIFNRLGYIGRCVTESDWSFFSSDVLDRPVL
jgi:hypothetical protein